eukprot:m.59782 g.59782  ORF g.59782 m.59782 type:complete len:192 (+) comp49277_c0_seq3:1190-1765(+)
MLKLKTTRLLTKQARAQYLSKTARGASAFLSADSAKLRHRGTNAVHMQFFNFQDLLLDVQKNPVLLEPRATRSGTDQHRFDLAVQGFDSTSTNLLLDVTVRSPLADRVMDQAAVNRLLASCSRDLWWPAPQCLQVALCLVATSGQPASRLCFFPSTILLVLAAQSLRHAGVQQLSEDDAPTFEDDEQLLLA